MIVWRYLLLNDVTVKHAFYNAMHEEAACGVTPKWRNTTWGGHKETLTQLRQCRRCINILRLE